MYHKFFIANWILQGAFGWLLLNSHICMQPVVTVQPWFNKWSSIPIHSFPDKFIVIKSEMRSTIKLFLSSYKLYSLNWNFFPF